MHLSGSLARSYSSRSVSEFRTSDLPSTAPMQWDGRIRTLIIGLSIFIEIPCRSNRATVPKTLLMFCRDDSNIEQHDGQNTNIMQTLADLS